MNEKIRLLETVEAIRASSYPTLDADLVQEILAGQIRLQDDRSEASRHTERSISKWATENASDSETDDSR